MRPVVVVVGLTYTDARKYVLTHQATRPVLQGARLLSSSAGPAAAQGLTVAKVIETPAAKIGSRYAPLMLVLDRARASAKPLR